MIDPQSHIDTEGASFMPKYVRTSTSASYRYIIIFALVICCIIATAMAYSSYIRSSTQHTATPVGISSKSITSATPQHAFAQTITASTHSAITYPLLGESDSIQVLCSDTGNAMVRVTASTINTSHVKITVVLPDTQPNYTIVLFDSIAPRDGTLHLTEPVPMDRDIIVNLTINSVAGSNSETASDFSGSKLFRTPYC